MKNGFMHKSSGVRCAFLLHASLVDRDNFRHAPLLRAATRALAVRRKTDRCCNTLTKPKLWPLSQFRRGKWRPARERSGGSRQRRRRRRKEQEPAGRQRRGRLAVGSGARPAEHAAASRVVPVPRHRAGHVAQVHVEELFAGLRRVSHRNLFDCSAYSGDDKQFR